MKKFLFVLSFLGASLGAQTLQFSQVKLVTVAETVPAGRVWKIEGFFPTIFSRFSAGAGTTEGYIYNLVINGNPRPVGMSSFLTGVWDAAYQGNIGHFPLWIPAGTSLAAGSNVGEISVIEFIIQP